MASANLRYLALRSRLSGVLQASLDPAAMYDVLAGELYRALAHYTTVGFFRREGDHLLLLAGRGIEAGTVLDAPSLAASTSPLLMPDVTRDDRARPLRPEIVAELAVPIVYNEAPIALIDVQSRRPGALGYNDREFLAWLAEQLALLAGARIPAEQP